MEKRDSLPVHPIPEEVNQADAEPRLLVEGLVEQPRELTREDLRRLRRDSHAEDFACLHGWVVEGLQWEGTPLADVLDAVGAGATARYVRVSAGDFALPLPIERARTALLADRLNGEPLTLAHGAPWRLVLPEGECFTSVKWVSRIEVTDEPGANTAEVIARGRLPANV